MIALCFFNITLFYFKIKQHAFEAFKLILAHRDAAVSGLSKLKIQPCIIYRLPPPNIHITVNFLYHEMTDKSCCILHEN